MRIHLKPGRERSLRRRHPWIFSGAILRVEGDPQPGDTVAIADAQGEFLAWAAYSPKSQIRARVYSWDRTQEPNLEWFRARIAAAVRQRSSQSQQKQTSAYLVVHAESDGLPGLIVDRYNDGLIVQALSTGAAVWLPELAPILAEETDSTWIYERSDVEVRHLEGLTREQGSIFGEAPAGPLEILENSISFCADVRNGNKTGFYLDQRDNRQFLGQRVQGKRVLSCFAYSAAFDIYALVGGAAHVTRVESSGSAEALALNDITDDKTTPIQADVFETLRKLHADGEKFDTIILDPPKFARTARQAQKAARGYKDINLNAMRLLAPGGELHTFSCSGGVDADLFQKIVAGAALDASLNAKIVARLNQGGDHPVALNFPEGAYLKGLVVAAE